MGNMISKVNKAGFFIVTQQEGKYNTHELLEPSATKLYRHIKIKEKANPFHPEYREYFQMRSPLSDTVNKCRVSVKQNLTGA